MTMRAARFHGAGDVRVEQVDAPPAPGPGEVLLRVRTVGICGSDGLEYRMGPVLVRPLDVPHPVFVAIEKAGPALAWLGSIINIGAIAGLASKINREEVYHRMHAEMWRERLHDEPRFHAAVDELWPYALGVLDLHHEKRGSCRLCPEPAPRRLRYRVGACRARRARSRRERDLLFRGGPSGARARSAATTARSSRSTTRTAMAG